MLRNIILWITLFFTYSGFLCEGLLDYSRMVCKDVARRRHELLWAFLRVLGIFVQKTIIFYRGVCFDPPPHNHSLVLWLVHWLATVSNNFLDDFSYV